MQKVQLYHYVVQPYGEILRDVNLPIIPVVSETGSATPILLDSIFLDNKCNILDGAREEEMTGNRHEFADYCAAMIFELAAQSQEHDMPVLAYLLRMATHELNDLRSGLADSMI